MKIPIEIPTVYGTIRSILHVPKSTTNKNILIFCYGFNGNRVEDSRLSYKLSDLCERNGIISTRFDYIGHGISDGDFNQVNFETKVCSVIEVIDFLCGCLNNPEQKITLIGFSDGAKVALKVAEIDYRVNKIVLWNPVLIDSEVENDTSDLKLSRDYYTNKIYATIHGLPTSFSYLKELDSLEYELADLESKIISFFNKDDGKSKATMSYFERNNLSHCIKLLETGGHLFFSTESENNILNETLKILNLTKERIK